MGRDHRFLRLLTAFSRRRPNNDESAVVTTRRCKLCLKGILHPLDGIFADGKNGKFIPATVILHLRMSIFNYGTFFTPREKWNENLGKFSNRNFALGMENWCLTDRILIRGDRRRIEGIRCFRYRNCGKGARKGTSESNWCGHEGTKMISNVEEGQLFRRVSCRLRGYRSSSRQG